jgi:WG containing repeat
MRLLLLLLLSVLVFQSFAQKTLFPIVENGRHGFIDSTGKIIVPPQFNTLQPFSEGLAAARLGGYYGYIDSMGSWVIPPQYDKGNEFYSNEIKASVNPAQFW